MSDDLGECETPIADHVRHFWQLLETEHVRICVDLRREIGHESPDGPCVYWDSSTFSNNVAKAILASRDSVLSTDTSSSRSPSLHRESLLNPTNQPPESGER